jgi:glycosyltransferase involved in cell wall biosynthesis
VNGPDLTVVVLAYDEEANAGWMLRELREWLVANEPAAEIVVVDDGSTDRTGDEARAALERFDARFARHERNRGIGAALKTGVALAQGRWVTFLPADGQIPPEAIGTLRGAARQDDADVVLSVYDHRDDGIHRKLFSWGVRALITTVHGVRLRSDGPYLFRRTLFDPAQLPADTFFLNFEFPIRVLAAGLRVSTVTVACRRRVAGHSKSTGLSRIAGVARDLLELRVRRTREGVRRALGRPW